MIVKKGNVTFLGNKISQVKAVKPNIRSQQTYFTHEPFVSITQMSIY